MEEKHEAKKKCTKCGIEHVTDDAFCGKCGGELKAVENVGSKKRCKRCGAIHVTEEVLCSKCGGELAIYDDKVKENRGSNGKGCLVVLGILLICTVLMLGITSIIDSVVGSSSSSTTSSQRSNDSDTKIWARKLVEDSLKAPSTAKFCSYSKMKVTKSGGNTIVSGYVDAENSFGAKIRSDWKVVFKGGNMGDYTVLID